MSVRVTLGEKVAGVRNEFGGVEFDLGRGSINLTDPEGRMYAENAFCRVQISVKDERGTKEESYSTTGGYHRTCSDLKANAVHGEGVGFRVECRPAGSGPKLAVEITMYEEIPGAFLTLEMTNALDQPICVSRLDALVVDPDRGGAMHHLGRADECTLYNMGFANGYCPLLQLADTARGRRGKGPLRCYYAGTFQNRRTQASFIAGFTSQHRMVQRVAYERREADSFGAITASCDGEGRPLPGGESLRSERLYIEFGASGVEALLRYARLLGAEMHALTWEHVPTGWCSWYYFFTHVTDDAVMSNLDFLAKNRERIPVEFIQVDDGYQKHWGDWLERNEQFPRELKELADEIKKRGFKPGLWVAPFVAYPESDVAKEHPEWLLRKSSGEAVLVRGWGKEQPWNVLDATNPEVQQHLEHMFHVITEEWGYEYVKLDALTRACPHAFAEADPRELRLHDASATVLQMYRRGMAAIRRGIGDRFMLGCGGPAAPSVGIVNGMRVSPDVGPVWSKGEWAEGCTIRASMYSSLRRVFMHQTMWLNDPDCLIVRDGGPEWHQATRVSVDEARSLATMVAVTGGMNLLSDNLPELPEERMQMINAVLPVYGRAAVALDLLENDPPELFSLPVEHRGMKWCVAAAFNWTDSAKKVSLPLNRVAPELLEAGSGVFAFDFWHRRLYRASPGEANMELGETAAHAVRLMALREDKGKPQFAGSSFHFTQGWAEIEALEETGEKIVLTLAPYRGLSGKLFFSLPDGWSFRGVSGNAEAAVEDGVVVVSVTLSETMELALEFSKA